MNNPYSQFNIRPQRPCARLHIPYLTLPYLQADQANTANSGLNSLNLQNPAAGSGGMLSPSVAYESQRYNAMYSGAPLMPMNRNTDLSSLGPAAFSQWVDMQFQRYMANCTSGVAVMPAVPLSVGNQMSTPRWPANVLDSTAMMQFMLGSAALLRNQMPVLPPADVAVQQSCNVPAFQTIPIAPNSLNPADSLSCDANIPFRQVQWMPPVTQETAVPKIPYTVENKPDCKTEIASEDSLPTVYVDIAADSSTRLDAGDRSCDTSLVDSNVIVVQPVEKPGKRKSNQCRRNGREKVTKLSDKYVLKPCVVSLVRIDASVSDCHESNDNVEESSDNDELIESDDDLSPQPEVSLRTNNPDLPVPVALYASSLPEAQDMLTVDDISVMPVLETQDVSAQSVSERAYSPDSPTSATHDASPVLEAQEMLNNHNVPVDSSPELADNVKHSTGLVPQVQNNEVVTLPVVQENTNNSPSDQLIGSDEDVGEDFSHDDGNHLLNENENASTEQSVGYKVMLTDSDGLLFDMECDDDQADETLRVMLPSKTLETTCEKTGSASTSKTSPPKTYNSEQLRELASATLRVLLHSNTLETSKKTASATTSKTAPSLPPPPKISNVKHLRKLLPRPKPMSKPVCSIVVDDSEDSDDDVSIASTTNSGIARSSQRLAASACRERISATIQQECFDIEGDTEEGETLHATSTATQFETTREKTGSAASRPTSKSVLLPREAIQSKQLQLNQTPTASESNIITIDADLDNTDDVVVVSSEASTVISGVAGYHNLAAVARNEKSAKCNYTPRAKNIAIKENVNSFLDIPLQSSFFRFEAQSSEVFRLLSIEKSCVPCNVLTDLADLIASVDAVDKQFFISDASRKVPPGIGGSRTLFFQCLFCPYGEMSAKRVMVHVKQQHRKYASIMQRSLLPSSNLLLYMYCRHCNFVTYDSAAMFIHFALYHRVPGILLSGPPKDIEDDPDWAPVFNPQAVAKEFPFYCCPNCDYMDNEWSRIIQHVLKQHFSTSVFLGCVVKLFMVGWPTKSCWWSLAYESLAKEPQARTQMYACIGCRFFTFCPSHTFCHYIVSHRSLAMLYVCAGNVRQCSKQFTSVENVISHLWADHLARRRGQLQCVVTLFDAVTSTELHISPGYLVPRDVPVHIRYRSSPSSVTASTEAAIEIVDDDDSADDDDVIVLHPDPKDKATVDVEPDSALPEGCNDCIETPGNDPCSESAVDEHDGKGTSESCSSSRVHAIGGEVVKQCGKENVKTSGVHAVGDKTSVVIVDDTDVMDTVCSSEDLHVIEQSSEQNIKNGPDGPNEDGTSKIMTHDSQHEVSVMAVLCSFVDSEYPSNKTSSETAAVVDDVVTCISSDDESCTTELTQAQNPVMQTSQTVLRESSKSATLSSMDTSGLIGSAASLVNRDSIPINGESSVASAVHQADNLLLQEDPALNNVCTTKQKLLTSTGSNGIEVHKDCSSTDDMFCSSEHPKSPISLPESQECSVVDFEDLLLAEELASDEPEQLEQSSKVQHTVSTCSAFSDDESRITGMENPCFASVLDTSDDAVCSDVVENEQSYSCIDSLPPETDAASGSVPEECGKTSLPLPFNNDCSSDIPVESRASEISERAEVSTEQHSE